MRAAVTRCASGRRRRPHGESFTLSASVAIPKTLYAPVPKGTAVASVGSVDHPSGLWLFRRCAAGKDRCSFQFYMFAVRLECRADPSTRKARQGFLRERGVEAADKKRGGWEAVHSCPPLARVHVVSVVDTPGQRQVSAFRSWRFESAMFVLFDPLYVVRQAALVAARVVQEHAQTLTSLRPIGSSRPPPSTPNLARARTT